MGDGRSATRLLGPASSRSLDRLAATHDQSGGARVVVVRRSALATRGWWSRAAGRGAPILVVFTDGGPPAAIPGPWVLAGGEGPVAVGVLTDHMLAGAADAAERVRRRPERVGPIALLGPGDARTKGAIDALIDAWPKGGSAAPPFRWTSDRVGWEDLRPGLKSGLGSVMYLGHGEPGAWAAYGGITADRLTDAVLGATHRLAGRPLDRSSDARAPDRHPIAVLFAFTCHAAGGGATGVGPRSALDFDPASIGAQLVASGTVGSVFAGIGTIAHQLNRSMAVAASAAIAAGHSTIGDVVSSMALDPRNAGLLAYRILGDPSVRLSGEASAWSGVGSVPATDPADLSLGASGPWPSQL